MDALDALDTAALTRDAAAAVRVPSVTGDERAVLELLAETAAALGLEADLHRHDLAALRRHPGHPGEEAERSELWGLTATLPGGPRRICLNGHVDMKAATVAALHAAAALRTAPQRPTVVVQCVSGEEDGGLGTFAALERDAVFDAALIPEPTGFDVVCAQAGALTFRGVVPGRAAHAAQRLEGRSAIDRYVAVHAALAEHERRVNTAVEHPLMRRLPLPYPLLVGRVSAGTWSSQVPDRLEFEGRLGVPVGADVAAARAALETVVEAALDDGEAPAVLTWTGGSFAPAETAPEHPWVRTVTEAVQDELGRPVRAVGVPWGADMRHFTARGIPCTMVGTSGIELAHAVDEHVRIPELVSLARALVRVLARAG